MRTLFSALRQRIDDRSAVGVQCFRILQPLCCGKKPGRISFIICVERRFDELRRLGKKFPGLFCVTGGGLRLYSPVFGNVDGDVFVNGLIFFREVEVILVVRIEMLQAVLSCADTERAVFPFSSSVRLHWMMKRG